MLPALFIDNQPISYTLYRLRAGFAHYFLTRLARGKPAVFQHGYLYQLARFKRIIYFSYHFGPYLIFAYLEYWLQLAGHSSENRPLLGCYHILIILLLLIIYPDSSAIYKIRLARNTGKC